MPKRQTRLVFLISAILLGLIVLAVAYPIAAGGGGVVAGY